MIVTLDKNKKLRLTYDGRSYIIHNNDNHYYIMRDNEKIYCTKEVKEYYKKTKQSQQPKSQPKPQPKPKQDYRPDYEWPPRGNKMSESLVNEFEKGLTKLTGGYWLRNKVFFFSPIMGINNIDIDW